MVAPLTITDVRVAEVPGVVMGEGLVLPWDRTVMTVRDCVAVRVETAEGHVGITVDGDWRTSPQTDFSEFRRFATGLVGRSILELPMISPQLESRTTAQAPRYTTIEIALWDIIGKAAGQPLYQLWGGALDRVRAYASTVHYGKSPQERVDDCLRYRDRGYRAVKLRLSEDTVEQDLVTVEACATALGDSMQIMVDANQAGRKIGAPRTWDLSRALQTASRLADSGVVWLEEPLTRELPPEVHTELAARAETPIAGGEGLRGHQAFWEVCTKHLYNIVQPDPVVSGTISTLLEIARMCRAADLPFAYHHGKGGVGMLVALHLQAAFGMGDHLEVMDDPGHWNPEGFQVGFRAPVLPDEDGYVVCSSEPGLGADWDPDWLERYGLN